MSSPEELTTQRFYLRKLEGAEILLANEINFFRQELHKWAPVAPTPPPILSVSLSTRKPRPTKQQKLMTQLGISNPDDLPSQYRTKTHQFKQRKSIDATKPQSLQPAPEPSHTPPGEPPGVQKNGFAGEQDYFNTSSTFPSNGQVNFGASSSSLQEPLQTIDPGLFEGPGQGPTSPLQDVFKSSGSQEMFGEVLESGGGQAEEALAATEGNIYVD